MSQNADLYVLGAPQYISDNTDDINLLFPNKTDPILIKFKD